MVFVRFRRVPSAAPIWVADDFLDAEEIGEILALVGDGATWDATRDETGLAFELPVAAHPALVAINRRVEAALGFANAYPETLRFRRYAPGEFHGPHLDCYDEADGSILVATAMVCLTAPEVGGETRFPRAGPTPVLLTPVAGRLAVWLNYGPDGQPDPASEHEALPVLAGAKATLTAFVYAGPDAAPALARVPAAQADIPGVRFEPAA